MKDIPIDEGEYERHKYATLWLKKPVKRNKRKYTDTTCHFMYISEGLWDKK